jgi:hypothetical protein
MSGRFIPTLYVAAVFVGCERSVDSWHRPPSPVRSASATATLEPGQRPETAFDFGEVSLDEGAVRLEHEFVVRNPSQHTIGIEKVTTSCGCVEAAVAQSTLQAMESTTLRVAIEVAGVGRTEQSATVAFSDGTATTYWLHAIGTRSTQLHVGPLRHRISGSSRSIQVTLQVVDRRGRLEQGAPRARIGDQTLPVSFYNWTVIEPRNEVTDRPLRQSTAIEIDLTPYAGPFPVVIDVTTASGLAANVTVDLSR